MSSWADIFTLSTTFTVVPHIPLQAALELLKVSGQAVQCVSSPSDNANVGNIFLNLDGDKVRPILPWYNGVLPTVDLEVALQGIGRWDPECMWVQVK